MNMHVPFSRFCVSDFTQEESNYLRVILGKRKHTFYDAGGQFDFSELLQSGATMTDSDFETHLLDSDICILNKSLSIENLSDYILSTTPIFAEAQEGKYFYGKTVRNGTETYYVARKYSDYCKYDPEVLEGIRAKVGDILQIGEVLETTC